MSERREELVEKGREYFLAHGVAGLSLRPLAAELGTSPRLLVYHFGSKDGLVTAVMEEVQNRIQASFRAFMAKPHETETIEIFWSWIIQPANLRSLRLLFEVQALALQNPEGYAHYLEGASSNWLKLIEASMPPSKESRTLATLAAAVIDGLLIEYLSTGDKARTTRALVLFGGMMKEREAAMKR